MDRTLRPATDVLHHIRLILASRRLLALEAGSRRARADSSSELHSSYNAWPLQAGAVSGLARWLVLQVPASTADALLMIIRRPRGGSQQGGFSLVEVMVATTVLMVGIGGTLMANVAARNLMRTSRETRAATLAATSVLEGSMMLSPSEVVAQNRTGEALAVGDHGLRGLTVVPRYPGFVAGDELVVIELTVGWTTFNGGTRSLVFETARR